MYSLKMSVCRVPFSAPGSTPWRSRGDQVHAEDRDGRAADRHRGGDVAERDRVEQHVHVGGAVDGNAAVPDLAECAGVVGVTAHQRGHVERDRQPAATFTQDHPVALVGLAGVAESGELADGPRPPAVTARVQPAGERELAGPADALEARGKRVISRRAVDRLHLLAGKGREVGVTHP